MHLRSSCARGIWRMRYFAVLASLFVAALLVSNVAAQKLIQLGPFVFPGGILLFPVTYIFGDVLTEVYGFARTREVIWAGFAANVVMALFLALVIALPAAPGWLLQREFAAALGMVPRVVVASLAGYLAGEFINAFVLARMKVVTEGRHLWARTIGSTVVGQAVDTALFVSIAFGGVLPLGAVARAAWWSYVFKVLYEAAATPLTYALVGWLKRAEGAR
jgi:queuosine precursor transporter